MKFRRTLALSAAVTASLAIAGPAAATNRPLRILGATADTALTQRWQDFGRRPGVGWAAADGTYSTRLPSGLDVWLYNDTFFGPVRADDSLPESSPFTHNSAVLSTPDAKHLLTTIAPGPPGHPKSLVGPTPNSPGEPNDYWYWNGDGIVDGGKLRVIEFEQAPTDDPPPFNFAWTKTKLATLDPYTFRLEKLTDVASVGNVQWGTELTRDGAWTYIYGVEGEGFTKYLHVARAPIGLLRRAVAVPDRDRLVGRPGGVGTAARQRRQLLRRHAGGRRIPADDVRLGPGKHHPRLPRDQPGRAVHRWRDDLHRARGRERALHLQRRGAPRDRSRPGELVISYNTNSEKLADLYANIDNNRPRFVDLKLSR